MNVDVAVAIFTTKDETPLVAARDGGLPRLPLSAEVPSGRVAANLLRWLTGIEAGTWALLTQACFAEPEGETPYVLYTAVIPMPTPLPREAAWLPLADLCTRDLPACLQAMNFKV